MFVSIRVRHNTKEFALRFSFVVSHPGFSLTLLVVTHPADSLSAPIHGTFHHHKVVAEQVELNLVGNKVLLNWSCSRFNSADEWL